MTGRLANKVIIITGAAHGIGKAIAECAAAEGASLIIADIADSIADCASALQERGVEAQPAVFDVRDAAAWSNMVEQVLERHGRIDGLVNNAGVNVMYEPLAMPEAEWDRCLDVDLRGSWNGCRAVLPSMKANGAGSIVNIASVHGSQIIPGSFPYPVAKHGLIGLTRALGVEYAPAGIRVNAISPGYIETRLCQIYWEEQGDTQAARACTEKMIPMRRVGQPEEVGMTAVFLLSDEARFIAAENLVIDGGRSALHHD